MSKISPKFTEVNKLIKAIKEIKLNVSNANLESIEALKNGRYGLMDGDATRRAAIYIDKIQCEFKHCWPESPYNYNQPGVFRQVDDIALPIFCGICQHKFYVAKNRESKDMLCPWCGVRIYQKGIEESI